MNTNPTTRDLVYLAGLLHDIGKFFQRADPSGAPKSDNLQDYKSLQQALCPTDRHGRYTHKHVLWTYQFFTTFRNLFTDVLSPEQVRQLARLAAAHHNPNPAQLEEVLLQKADHYSSGIDRTTDAGLQDEYAELNKEQSGNWDDFKKVRMVSVFETIHDEKKIRHRLPVAHISLNRSFFPQSSANDFDQSAPAQYQALWKRFADELDTLSAAQNRPRSVTALADTLLFLLEKYTTTVPSSTQHLPDVSLYDHLKSTAALALCLYDYGQEAQPTNGSVEDAPLLLVGGDLSGIQAFIYDIIGRSAAKNLKGRSFYLQLMVDSIVQHLLNGLRLHRANVVYSSGGGFYLLAPNTAFVRERLPDLQREIAQELRDEQGVKLYLAMDCQPVSQEQVYGQNGTIGDVWAGLTEKLAGQKKRRYANTLATDDYAFFFEPSEVGGESRGNRDAITSEEFSRDPKTGKQEETYPSGLDEDGANQRVRKPTFEQIRLGRTLRETVRYVVRGNEQIPYWEPDERTFDIKTDRFFNPLQLGQYYYFIGEKQLDKFRGWAKGSVDNVLIQSVNSSETTGFALPGNNQTYGFIFYGGNTIPRTAGGEPKYFEDLAGNDALNFKRLGILRMDVDNLGFLFKNGFSAGKRTFSRYSTLSRSLDYFFKGYLNQIREQDADFREYTFILYAGGDDLFIVGKWDVTLRFAETIQREFAAWTCHSDRLGISGGVAVVPPKFPIAKAADQSANEEKLAKGHRYADREKNSLSLFDTPLAWGEEWRIVTELKNDLKRHIGGEKNIPKSLIGKIGTLYLMQEEQARLKQNPSWRWLSAYDLGRARERAKSEEAKRFFDQLKTDLFTNRTYKGKALTGSNYDFLTLLNVAARWAELEMRSENTQTD